MNCLECRRLTLIDPNDQNPARATHLATCSGCSTFADQMLKQDELIREAAHIEVPEGFAARILLNHSLQPAPRRPARRLWLGGLAATLLLGMAMAPALLNNFFYKPFEDDLLAHISKHDVFAGHEHREVSSPGKIEEVLLAANTAMPGEIGNILYASTCVIDGETMAHLLVANGDEEYVVFVMPQRSVIDRAFSREGWSGMLASNNERSYAILNRDGIGLSSAADTFTSQFGKPASI